jgi:4-hydroxybenzoyl-CoA thioesterase
MIAYERSVRFEEVDAAAIVFFARFLNWCHEAMEHFFDELPGGYADIILRRRIGFPAVHVTSDWRAPLRFGDAVRIEVSVLHIGTTSVKFQYVFRRLATASLPEDDVATVEHVCVVSNLETMTKMPIPEDCRALFEAHRTR